MAEHPDVRALDEFYRQPAAEPGHSAGISRWRRLWTAARAWWRANIVEEIPMETVAARRLRLGRIALKNAKYLAALPERDRVEVLRELVRLADVEPWVRVARIPDRRVRQLVEDDAP